MAMTINIHGDVRLDVMCVVGKTIHQIYMAIPYSTQHKEKGESLFITPMLTIQGPRVDFDIYALLVMDMDVALMYLGHCCTSRPMLWCACSILRIS
jgi:hypothetical protein